jgi:hypothetical protein
MMRLGGNFMQEGGSNPPDGADPSVPFNINDRSTWVGSYVNLPPSAKLTDPLPAKGSGWEPAFNSWGEYIAAREAELRDTSGATPVVGMDRYVPPKTAPTAVPVKETPTPSNKIYLIKNDKNEAAREVTLNEYLRHKGLKTELPKNSDSGWAVQPGSGGKDFKDYIRMDGTKMEGGGTFAEGPRMKNNGVFDKKIGDPIEFMHGGKKVKGVIKNIKDGKIYL